MVNEAALVAAKQHAAHIDTAGLEFAQVTDLVVLAVLRCACLLGRSWSRGSQQLAAHLHKLPMHCCKERRGDGCLGTCFRCSCTGAWCRVL